jgi:hypothetical protein
MPGQADAIHFSLTADRHGQVSCANSQRARNGGGKVKETIVTSDVAYPNIS